jgi:hypothetical protein
MSDPGNRLGLEQAARRRREELEDRRRVVERRRVRDVDDDGCPAQRVGHTLSGDGVDARAGRRRQHLMAVLTKQPDQLRSHASGAADDHDLHGVTPSYGAEASALRSAT